jgi:tRNA-dihydrouridine synthase B
MPSGLTDNLLARLLDPNEKPVCAGPLAGWTDSAYRPILSRCGTRHLWIPFVSSHAVVDAKSPNRDPYLREVIAEGGHVQIFGADPEINAKAAKIVESCGAQTIDFNLGCSVKKVQKGGGGSVLLKNIDLLTQNLVAIKNAVSIPVSMKTRIGYHAKDDTSGLEACRRAADIGYSWVTLHGRTAKQEFGGSANWDVIASLVDELSIPVIGNGDVTTPEDAARMFEQTGCAGVMIGRAIMGDPWLIGDCENYLANREPRPHRTREEVVEIMLDQQARTLEKFDDVRRVWEFRKHIARYLRGFAMASKLRYALVRSNDPDEVRRMLTEFGEGKFPGDIG